MPEFCIKSEEIEQMIQLSKLQGGSKHRQKDIYALLDRVVARGEITMPDNFAEITVICPYCFAEITFAKYQVCGVCNNCKKGVFRNLAKEIDHAKK